MKQQIWTHIRSGDKYVVIVDEDNKVMQAAGPIHHTEIVYLGDDKNVGAFDGNAETADWLIENSEDFRIAE